MTYKLMTPGPTPTTPQIQSRLSEDFIHHRSSEYQQILKEVLDKLKWLFQTKQHVMLLLSSGTGAMEAALTNTLSKGDAVLALSCGKFGDRWTSMAETWGLSVDTLKSPLGEAICLETLKKQLATKKYKAVLCQHCETSTGILNPISSISPLIDKDTLFVVDGSTSLGATTLEMDKWGIDILLTSSQKTLMLPTGLSFISLSEKAWSFKSDLPCYYFNLKKEKESNASFNNAFSGSTTLLYALKESLELFQKENLQKRIFWCKKLAQATRETFAAFDVPLFAKAPSPTLTALQMKDNWDGEKIKNHVKEKYNILIAGGQDALKGKILRIGHMGNITKEDLLETLSAILKTLFELEYIKKDEEKLKTVLNHAEKILKEDSCQEQ